MSVTRRKFMKGAGAAAAATVAWPSDGRAQDVAPLRIALIGCGGRGTGAAENCMQSAPKVELTAMADAFPDRMARSRGYFAGAKLPGYKVPDNRTFTGIDGYKKIMDLKDVDLVLLTTPPGFRRFHVEAAIDAGKHVFMEKPAALDPVGVRHIIELGEKAKEKKLAMVAGTQYRHQISFQETVKRVHEGAIGKIIAGRAYYNSNPLKPYHRKAGESDTEWQIRNWIHFDWTAGDQPVEQHLHTIDVTDWVMGARPVACVAMGGRQVRTDAVYGNVWDHWCMDYEYPGGAHVMSMCRQMMNTDGYVGAHFTGTEGEADPYNAVITGKAPWQFPGKPDIFKAYVQEHTDLIASIRAGQPLNESRMHAESCLTAIMGREAAYTGARITWSDLQKSTLCLHPEKVDLAAPLPFRPAPVPTGKERKA